MNRKISHLFLNQVDFVMGLLIIFPILCLLLSCGKIRELDQEPEIQSLQDGLRTSATIGYCASLANTLFQGYPLPENVIFQSINSDTHSGAGILFVDINSQYPLPFNPAVGKIIIAGIWNDEHDGVITILLTDIDLRSFTTELLAIHTIPVIYLEDTGNILTLLAEQDIVVGEGADTLLNLSLTNPQFDLELARGNQDKPSDVFAAVTQNVWFVEINSRKTPSDLYDDLYTFNGGGQIVEAKSQSGGILYHSLIRTKLDLRICLFNPIAGMAFIQNVKAGSFLDLGNALLDFQDNCDGSARVSFASGKYFTSNGTYLHLNLQ